MYVYVCIYACIDMYIIYIYISQTYGNHKPKSRKDTYTHTKEKGI